MFYFALAIGLVFAYIGGMHDGGTIVATTIHAGLFAPKKALLIAGLANFMGAILLGTAVARTIASSLVDTTAVLARSEQSVFLFVIATFVGCISWDIVTWLTKLPSSSSHALIGAMVGATLSSLGTSSVFWGSIFVKVILAMIISPLLGFAFGFIFLKAFKSLLSGANISAINKVRPLSVATTLLLAFSYGSNDSQKAMGVIAIALAAKTSSSITIPLWLLLACAAALSLGTITGGYNMVTTVGRNITKVNIDSSFSSQCASILVLLTANLTGIPISTTQVVTGTVMGVGTENTPRSVNWGVTKNIVIAWITTIPASALIAGLCYYLGASLF